MKRMQRISTALVCAGALGMACNVSAQAVSTFDSGLDGWQAVGFNFDIGTSGGLPPTVTLNITKTDNSADLVWDAGGDLDPAFNGNSGGSPDGFARFTDVITDPASFLEAPASFSSGLSGLAGETISYDHRIFNEGSDATSVGPYVIALIAGDPNDLNAYAAVMPGPMLGDADTGWVTVSTTLDAANFTAITDVDLGVFDPSLAGVTAGTVPFGNFQTSMTFDQVLASNPALYISFEMVDNNSTQVSEADGVDNVVLTPEPSSLALLGLGGLLVARRRRG